MSRIKELKEDPKNIISIIDILQILVPEKKTKYVDLLLNLMKSTPSLNEEKARTIGMIKGKFPFIVDDDFKDFTPIQTLVIKTFLFEFFDSELSSFREFCELNEAGYIERNDLSTYKSMTEIKKEKEAASLKRLDKMLEHETKKVYEDAEWLIVRPISLNSSKKYGSGTKWCTTMDPNGNNYFENYATKGVLTYTINKKTGYKVAAYYSLEKGNSEFSFWNASDSRVDPFGLPVPNEILMMIRAEALDAKAIPNTKLKKS